MNLHSDNLLHRLDEHQAKAFDIIKRGDVLLAVNAIPDQGLLSAARWELTRVLGAYQAFKHHELFDPIIRNGPPDKARLAEQMKAECIAIGEDYRGHVARCAGIDIVAHWDSYRPAVVKLLARIKAHMTRERWVAASLLITPVRAGALGELRGVVRA
ncbi:hypothetical protein [Sphingomonas sp. SRS2]|uniref:hypothetical protein n=1 Tax=Sphingomonas sp. SRS2 TaxID=133190 RepID=UPI0006184A9E|nr:hypothetical protein [Sphingomonas sp. SRS2]KKC24198.1 hypothetical protein WP12_20635 [Sphingomonas sp. SRS2]